MRDVQVAVSLAAAPSKCATGDPVVDDTYVRRAAIPGHVRGVVELPHRAGARQGEQVPAVDQRANVIVVGVEEADLGVEPVGIDRSVGQRDRLVAGKQKLARPPPRAADAAHAECVAQIDAVAGDIVRAARGVELKRTGPGVGHAAAQHQPATDDERGSARQRPGEAGEVQIPAGARRRDRDGHGPAGGVEINVVGGSRLGLVAVTTGFIRPLACCRVIPVACSAYPISSHK